MALKFPFNLPPDAKTQKRLKVKDFRIKPGTRLYYETIKEIRRNIGDANYGLKNLDELFTSGKVTEDVLNKMKQDLQDSLKIMEERLSILIQKKDRLE